MRWIFSLLFFALVMGLWAQDLVADSYVADAFSVQQQNILRSEDIPPFEDMQDLQIIEHEGTYSLIYIQNSTLRSIYISQDSSCHESLILWPGIDSFEIVSIFGINEKGFNKILVWYTDEYNNPFLALLQVEQGYITIAAYESITDLQISNISEIVTVVKGRDIWKVLAVTDIGVIWIVYDENDLQVGRNTILPGYEIVEIDTGYDLHDDRLINWISIVSEEYSNREFSLYYVHDNRFDLAFSINLSPNEMVYYSCDGKLTHVDCNGNIFTLSQSLLNGSESVNAIDVSQFGTLQRIEPLHLGYDVTILYAKFIDGSEESNIIIHSEPSSMEVAEIGDLFENRFFYQNCFPLIAHSKNQEFQIINIFEKPFDVLFHDNNVIGWSSFHLSEGVMNIEVLYEDRIDQYCYDYETIEKTSSTMFVNSIMLVDSIVIGNYLVMKKLDTVEVTHFRSSL